MRFICLDGYICLVTNFMMEEDIQTTDIGSSTMSKRKTASIGRSITGEMLVFRQGELPTMFDSSGMPNALTLEFSDEERIYTLNEVMLTSVQEMSHSYDNCEAMYCEYIAADIDVEKPVSETISVSNSNV